MIIQGHLPSAISVARMLLATAGTRQLADWGKASLSPDAEEDPVTERAPFRDGNGLMRRREASIHDIPITDSGCRFFGPRPDLERGQS
jgi:hypothetical protein